MTIHELLHRYAVGKHLQTLTGHLRGPRPSQVHLQGTAGSQRSLLLAAAWESLGQTTLAILPSKEQAAYFLNDLEKLINDTSVLYFPASYRRAYDTETTDNANVLLRAEVLNRIKQRKEATLVVTYPEAIFEQVINKKALEANTFTLGENDQLNLDFLNETLFEYRFDRVDFVTEPGQFSIRGGIVDIFSFSNDHPYRIELYDDRVESIRTFDIVDQLSVDRVRQMEILPNLEIKTEAEIRESILAYLGAEAPVWIQDPEVVAERLNQLFQEAERIFANTTTLLQRAEPQALFLSGTTLMNELEQRKVVSFGAGQDRDGAMTIAFSAQPQASFNKNFNLLAEDLKVNQSRNIQNILLVSGQIQADRLWAIFEDIGQHQLQLKTIVGALHEGFTDQHEGLAVYTDHQLFERYQRFKIKTGTDKRQAITLKELNALRFGDYVTHIDHGVGQFGGLQTIENNGKKQEAIKLMYKDGDILYVSIHALHKISRFGAKEGSSPILNKLGSPAWSKLKQKTKKRVKEIAFDLIQLYARRKAAKGHSFAPDNYLQHELEASFVYEDTPDQVKATQEVKRDMELAQPMDRLICGDVGFGKTEIAMRAAFKAAVDGKQVAVLVPTTVLAYQHYKSFRERFKDFPVEVDYINRFKSGKQEKDTLEKLASGKTDIIIGTHKLVGKGVKFKDLGLLIVDEEQKFGVGVKDKLKTLRVNIDTLTLTATPIPRTLQFSLMAARDLSIMTTPPPNRQPVETRVTGFSEEALRDALMAELKRGGQAFVINNRIENLREVAGMIQRLLPDARLAVAHGQMDGEKLEQIIMEFMEGESDILISTSIVENGLDVPNANTMVVFNAHQFGLAELHQLRGRVGRSNRQAHCMLISPPLSSLTEEARRRLHAIEQFSDLGSGFQIAMRDLEIRGAGDLLGGEQSGFISEMGFDAYQKILAEAVQELKQESFADLYPNEPKAGEAWVDECQLDTDLALLLPHEYVNQTEERLQLYQTLDSLTTEEELIQFAAALADRFGPLPQEAQELIASMRLRWQAAQLGFSKLVLKQGKLVLHFVTDQNSPYYQSPTFHGILLFIKDFHQKARMKQTQERLTLAVDQVSSIAETTALLHKMQESAVRT